MKKPACGLVVNVSLGLRLPPSGPSSSGCLSPEGDGLQPANSVPSFVLCMVLVVCYVRAFHVVALPQSGLLAQFSSLWLHSGHSSLILKKHCSPHLPAQPLLASGRCRCLRCVCTGGVTFGQFPPCYVALCASKSHHRLDSESVSCSLETSLLLRLPSRDRAPSLPLLSLSLLFFHLLYLFLPVFEDNDLLFWVPDVLCQHSEVVLWNLLSVEMFF